MCDETRDSGSRHCRTHLESRIVAVRTSNTAPAQIEVETRNGTCDLTVPPGATELLSLLVRFACGGKRIRISVTDDAFIEAVEAVN